MLLTLSALMLAPPLVPDIADVIAVLRTINTIAPDEPDITPAVNMVVIGRLIEAAEQVCPKDRGQHGYLDRWNVSNRLTQDEQQLTNGLCMLYFHGFLDGLPTKKHPGH